MHWYINALTFYSKPPNQTLTVDPDLCDSTGLGSGAGNSAWQGKAWTRGDCVTWYYRDNGSPRSLRTSWCWYDASPGLERSMEVWDNLAKGHVTPVKMKPPSQRLR